MRKAIQSKIFLLLISLFLVFIDQISKFLAVKNLIYNSSTKLIPGLINLRLVNNTGAAFSILSNSTTYLSILSFFVSLFLIRLIIKKTIYNYWEGISIAFLLGGCLGNGLDRWRMGYVIDFIELIPIDFPIFNFADLSINLAIIFYILNTFNINQKNKRESFKSK